MKRLVVLLSVIIPTLLPAQRLHLNLFGGFSNYLGDLQENSVTLEQSRRAYGAGVSYNINHHLALRGGVAWGKIGADDKTNTSTALQLRNLSFQSSVKEAHLMAEWSLFDLRYRKLTPYVFGGLALYHFNPFTYDTLGSKIYLQPLSTEGQGLAGYPERKSYKLTQFALPVGAGIRLRLYDNITVSYELGLRKLFTDHLDDVSSTYVDQTALAADRGSTAVAMAYRGGELKNGNTYPAEGAIRGNPKLKDWYYMHGLTIGIGLNLGRKKGARYDCPENVK